MVESCFFAWQVKIGAYFEDGGRILFTPLMNCSCFSSAALAIAVLMLFGYSLEDTLKSLSQTRSFVLENQGFQRQLVELEAMLKGPHNKKVKFSNDQEVYTFGSPAKGLITRSSSSDFKLGLVEVELLIPGLCTMDVKIARESSIEAAKQRLVKHANEFFLSYSNPPAKVAKSWVVLAMFGYDDMYDFPLEKEAIELGVQLELMKEMFGLEVFTLPNSMEQHVRWNSKCRFALVIFSVFKRSSSGEIYEEPWTFEHNERPGAPATFLQYNLLTTHLRAWDFGKSIQYVDAGRIMDIDSDGLSVPVTGQSYCSMEPIVFSFSPDPRDKRQFMRISTSANKPVQFHAPGEGGILGMGANAIVHRVSLGKVTKSINSRELGFMDTCPQEGRWDAAVKRQFSFDKMKAFLENKSEAGLAKRIRMASLLNSDGRVVEFYGLGGKQGGRRRTEALERHILTKSVPLFHYFSSWFVVQLLQ